MTTDADRQLQAALQALVAGDIGELIADARREAEGRVRARLADAFTDALLAEARAAIAEPAESRRPPERPSEEATGFYVYCVISADTQIPPLTDAIDPAHAPKVIREGRLAAVVSEVALEDFGEPRLRERLADMQWLERTARAHEGVLDAIAKQATLIPLRLCSVYRDASGVLEMLEREASALEQALDYLRGKTEWSVKVFARPSSTNAVTTAADSGTDYMRERQGDRDRRRQTDEQLHEACVAIHKELAELVADATTSAPQRPEMSGHAGQMLLNGVYLVESDQLQPFLDAVDRLQDEHDAAGLELEPTGPWPAYNFVPGTIGAAW